MTEHKMTYPILSWLTIILVAVGTVAWGLVNYYAIKDSDRHFDVGQITDTPARTPYSTVEPEHPAQAPRQLPLAPSTQEAKP